jgi:hypothetical protein
VVSVGILHLGVMLDGPDAGSEIHERMRHACAYGKAALARVAVGAQHVIGVEHRLKHGARG